MSSLLTHGPPAFKLFSQGFCHSGEKRSQVEVRDPVYSPAVLRQKGRAYEMVANKGRAGVRQWGGDSGASNPHPLLSPFLIIKNKNKPACPEHKDLHQEQAPGRAGRRLIALSRPKMAS